MDVEMLACIPAPDPVVPVTTRARETEGCQDDPCAAQVSS